MQRWQAFKLAMPPGGGGGGGGGFGLVGGIVADVSCPWGVGGGRAQGVFDDRDEWIGDLSSPFSHTSLSRHVSVSARSIW